MGILKLNKSFTLSFCYISRYQNEHFDYVSIPHVPRKYMLFHRGISICFIWIFLWEVQRNLWWSVYDVNEAEGKKKSTNFLSSDLWYLRWCRSDVIWSGSTRFYLWWGTIAYLLNDACAQDDKTSFWHVFERYVFLCVDKNIVWRIFISKMSLKSGVTCPFLRQSQLVLDQICQCK